METDSFYKIPEWSKLDLDIRADLVLLIEEVRAGANIQLWKLENRGELLHYLYQKIYLTDWLSGSGMKYINPKGDYYISRDESLLDKLGSGNIKIGDFLGYPSCCIKNFEEDCQSYLFEQKKGSAEKFWQNAKRALGEGKFDLVLYYVLHAPCDIQCNNSIGLAARIKLVLEAKDPEAAKFLKEYNAHLLKIFNEQS